MAKRKTESFPVALLHAGIYTLPFLLITTSAWASAVIFVTHAVIDHYRLLRFLIFAKNWVGDRSLRWVDCAATGYHKDTPPWLAVWLMIAVDNTTHLAINYAALRWL